MLPPFAAYEFPYPKSCHVYRSGSQTISSGVWTVIQLNTVSWDTYGFFTGGASQYITIPEDGLYLLIAQAQSDAVINSPLQIAVSRNGTQDIQIMTTQNTVWYTRAVISYMQMLNMNEKLDFSIKWTGTGSITIGTTWPYCFMQVLKLPYVTKGY